VPPSSPSPALPWGQTSWACEASTGSGSSSSGRTATSTSRIWSSWCATSSSPAK
jgi:hypothetical protein